MTDASSSDDTIRPDATPSLRPRATFAGARHWRIADGGGIQSSVDGETWSNCETTSVSFIEAELHDVAFRDAHNGWVVGSRPCDRDPKVCETVVLRTRDGGQTWDNVLPSHLRRNGETARSIRLIGQRARLLVVACTTRDGRGVIFSEDGGICWFRGGMLEFGQLGQRGKKIHA